MAANQGWYLTSTGHVLVQLLFEGDRYSMVTGPLGCEDCMNFACGAVSCLGTYNWVNPTCVCGIGSVCVCVASGVSLVLLLVSSWERRFFNGIRSSYDCGWAISTLECVGHKILKVDHPQLSHAVPSSIHHALYGVYVL